VDKRQTLTHPDCGHPPEELLLFFKCCAIETTINGRSDGQLDLSQLFPVERFVAAMDVKWKCFWQRRARMPQATVESGVIVRFVAH
jgi:hypothetical protein